MIHGMASRTSGTRAISATIRRDGRRNLRANGSVKSRLAGGCTDSMARNKPMYSAVRLAWCGRISFPRKPTVPLQIIPHTSVTSQWKSVLQIPKSRKAARYNYFMGVPARTLESTSQIETFPSLSAAARIIPWLTPNLIFLGLRLATTSTVLFSSSEGS
jgi:hypothetical protein